MLAYLYKLVKRSKISGKFQVSNANNKIMTVPAVL